jgi:imidazolonepropionase-like amidohydrolase
VNNEIHLAGGMAFDGTGAEPYAADVRIAGNRVVEVGAGLTPSADATVIDCNGATVMPGLIDLHIHMSEGSHESGSPGAEPNEVYGVLRAARDMARTVRAGITTVRDLGGRDFMEFWLRKAIQDGIVVGPRMKLAGKIISMTTAGSHWYPGMYAIADGADAVRRAAREQLAQGADLCKFMATAASFCPDEDPRWTQYSVEELRAGIEEAHKQGLPAAAHAEGVDGIRNAVEAGIDTIEHGDFLCEDESVIAAMAEKGVILVPTMKLYVAVVENLDKPGMPDFIRDNCQWIAPIHRESIRMAHAAGVTIAMGTDCGPPFNRHSENATELQLMVGAGMSPVEAIVAATANAGRALGMADSLGTLQPGHLADVIVVGGDPTEDVSILADHDRIELVISDGRIVSGVRGDVPASDDFTRVAAAAGASV